MRLSLIVGAGLQVLIEFPCELVSAVVAGRWAASSSPFKPFLFGYQARVIMAGVVTTIVRLIPAYSLLMPCTSLSLF